MKKWLEKFLRGSARLLLTIYKVHFSSVLSGACRFEPSCSTYSRDAFETYSFFKAIYLTVRRLIRCHPFGSSGFDPLPRRPH